MKKTKIICTMGPNEDNREIMVELAKNGMDIARFNFSHGDYEEQRGRLALLKSVREELNLPIAALLDTKGPEIRTGLLKDDKKVTLVEGQTYTLTTREIIGDGSQTVEDVLTVLFRDDALLCQHGGVHAAAAHILRNHALIEADGGVEVVHAGIHGLGKTALPELFCHSFILY